MENSHAKIAKDLLQGSSCANCRYCSAVGTSNHCALFGPIKIKYPNDVQIFINGVIIFSGLTSVENRYSIIDDEIHINQSFYPLVLGDKIIIYSRGEDESGKYDCQIINLTYTTKVFPDENICYNWTQKII